MTEQGWVPLAPGFLAVVANGLERHHDADIVSPFPGGLGVDPAAHLLAQEQRRFFVDEGDESHAAADVDARELTGDLQYRGDTAAVVVRAGTAEDAVVMCAEQQDLVRIPITAARDFQVGTGNAPCFIRLQHDLVAHGAPCFLDVRGGLREGLGMVDVAFADAFGERSYMALEAILE